MGSGMVIKTLKDWGAVAVAVLALAGVVYAAGSRSAELTALGARMGRVERKVDRNFVLLLELVTKKQPAAADADTGTE
jgi:hypothetical protein